MASPYEKRRKWRREAAERCPYRDQRFGLSLDAEMEAIRLNRMDGEHREHFWCRACWAFHLRRVDDLELP